jgi:putative transposase
MWTPTTRRQHSRAGLRYTSDLTDAEWGLLEPLLPRPAPVGRRWAWPLREIVNGLLYVLRAGCPWRLLPESFPPWRTVYRWFARLRDSGVLVRISRYLTMLDRERAGREASPMASVIDSQSVKTSEAGGPRGYDAGKKVRGRKRHAMVDTDGRLLVLIVHPADLRDRDGGVLLLHAGHRAWPFVEISFADAAYLGPRVANASPIFVEVIHKPSDQRGFVVHKRRWVVERSFAWLSRNRRLTKDFEATIASAEAFLYTAAASTLLRRLAQYT